MKFMDWNNSNECFTIKFLINIKRDAFSKSC